jgi:hypothetical protein
MTSKSFDGETNKRCKKCHEVLFISSFDKLPIEGDVFESRCRDCVLKQSKPVVPRVTSKMCSYCQQILSARSYNKSNMSLDGLAYMCRSCASIVRVSRKAGVEQMIPSTKICSACRLVQSIDEFTQDPKGHYGRHNICRKCVWLRRFTKRAQNQSQEIQTSG